MPIEEMVFLQHQHELDYKKTKTWIVSCLCCNFQIEVCFPLQTYLTGLNNQEGESDLFSQELHNWIYSLPLQVSQKTEKKVLIERSEKVTQWCDEGLRPLREGRARECTEVKYNGLECTKPVLCTALHCIVRYTGPSEIEIFLNK